MNYHELDQVRADLAFISRWVSEGSRVLDLGCGDGLMMSHLQAEKRCTGYGVEIDDDKIPLCVERGVAVIQQDMENGLSMFADDAFDMVLCLSSLQMMKNVERILTEIARVGREAIVSFPNFAFWPHRIALLSGRMPISKTLPYQWHDTPNLRCATIKDFMQLASDVGLEVLECVALDEGKPISFMPNLRGSLAVFRLRQRGSV
jgi:methionine biosynthesis protein MetW